MKRVTFTGFCLFLILKLNMSLRIVFFGTPDFAVASLKALIENGKNVVAVVTAPDKPAGRGRQLQSPPVKNYALTNNIPVLQPERLKSPEFLSQLRELAADLHIVVAFRMLPEVVWNMPPMGTINVHASLLPRYRGAAPINRAIMDGETETGVTTFKLKHEIDTGDILLQKKLPILPEDNAGDLHDKLMILGAELLVETVDGLAAGSLVEQPQSNFPESELRHAPKLFKEDMRVDWSRDGNSVINHIRGLAPYPAAWTDFGGKTLKLYRARFAPESHQKDPGTYEVKQPAILRFAVKDGWVYIEELQMEGKKRMPTEEFLKGFRG